MQKISIWIVVLSLYAIATSGFSADTNMLYNPRKWTSISGVELTASFVKLSGHIVILRNSQAEAIQIPREKLSSLDQLFLDSALGLSEFTSQELEPIENTIGSTSGGLTGGMEYSKVNFFGEEVRTRAIVICMDISSSMIAKGVTQDVLAESVKILEGLNTGTKFNFVVFVEGSDALTPQMVYATPENKDMALRWLKQPFDGRRQGNLRGYVGSSPYHAICMAVEMGADTIFILTDDPPHLTQADPAPAREIPTHMKDIETYVRSVNTTAGKSVGIYPILYKPHDNARGEEAIKFYKRIASMTKSRCRVIRRTNSLPTPTTPPPNRMK